MRQSAIISQRSLFIVSFHLPFVSKARIHDSIHRMRTQQQPAGDRATTQFLSVKYRNHYLLFIVNLLFRERNQDLFV